MSKSRLSSGKIKKKLGSQLDASRYEYLDVSQAEPDLGQPAVDNSFLVSNTATGSRSWSSTLTNISLSSPSITSAVFTGTSTGSLVLDGSVQVSGNIVGGGIRATSSSTAPTPATVGDIWYNTTNDRLYRYSTNSVYSFWLDYSGPTVQVTS